ncbi:hypothetical protein KY336_00580 [Candidatus Woesearchaeota archaeon]|nr:hypothetical protein [Candidatus Woesearchaeota archaeon]
MIRKVNRVGIDTLTVSLPRKWARKYDLEAGADINLDIEGHQIKICPLDFSTEKKIEFDLKEIQNQPIRTQKSLVRTILGNVYKSGYDNITLRFADKATLKNIVNKTDLLMGMTPVITSENRCVIKRILKEDPTEYPKIKKKLFQFLVFQVKEFYEALEKKKKISNEDLENFRVNIEKLGDFLKRLLAKNTSSDFNELEQNHAIITNIEKIAKEYRHFILYLNDYNVTISRDIMDYFKMTTEMLETFYEQYYNFDINNMYKLANKKNEMLFIKGYSLFSKCGKKEAPALFHIMNVVRRIWDMGGPLISLKIK